MFANLTEADLSNQVLTGIDLRRAELKGVNLSAALAYAAASAAR
ncbi:pentapeptide repeat-containing protein [Romeria aff. gracilis LEGE 07310]|uniref:Pentapeptide repeat-containing protein n=1 Tax=Vasconcelosia minhoensis LEGE 07310 TaxID=915328 RepID=A0A8J7A6V3_9CYAN|nr:pentapeptide repeat-containing protein [Romeria aff. gracilis LEGE 07310]